MEAVTASTTRTVMSQIMTPEDANFLGKVFGGKLLSLIDLCAYTTAARFSGQVCVTASFDRVDFLNPIDVGDVVTLEGYVSFVGRTSVEVTIEVFAENVLLRSRAHTNTARVTMVAIKDGKPVAVPRLVCETREEKIRFLAGRYRRELRPKYTEERERYTEELHTLSDAELDQRLAD